MPVTINGSGAISGLVITTADLADSSVTTAKIADGAVATADLANGAVTNAKMATGAAVANIGFTPADATATVNLTGNQSIGGTKTFTSGITFNDGTTQTTAASGVPTTFQAVGSYVIGFGLPNTTTTFSLNTTYAGSSIRAFGGNSSGIFLNVTTLSGTWRSMGNIGQYGVGTDGTNTYYVGTLFVRIS